MSLFSALDGLKGLKHVFINPKSIPKKLYHSELICGKMKNMAGLISSVLIFRYWILRRRNNPSVIESLRNEYPNIRKTQLPNLVKEFEEIHEIKIKNFSTPDKLSELLNILDEYCTKVRTI